MKELLEGYLEDVKATKKLPFTLGRIFYEIAVKCNEEVEENLSNLEEVKGKYGDLISKLLEFTLKRLPSTVSAKKDPMQNLLISHYPEKYLNYFSSKVEEESQQKVEDLSEFKKPYKGYEFYDFRSKGGKYSVFSEKDAKGEKLDFDTQKLAKEYIDR